MSNFHLQEIQTLQNSLREREEYVIELENRLRALWDKYDGNRKHYMERIKRLEDALSRIANQDYRGNRSTESQIAEEALKEGKL